MTFKTIAFVTVLVSAVVMGACGKSDSFGAKDTSVVGSCTYTQDGVSLCEQVNVSKETSNDAMSKAADGIKADCAGAEGNKFSSSGCSKGDSLGGCRGNNGVTTVVYKGARFTTSDQVKAECAQRGLEFVSN